MKTYLLLATLSLLLGFTAATAPKILLHKTKDCKLEIGDTFAGGIVVHLDPGPVCHGLVCAPMNQGTNVEWAQAVSSCNSLHTGGYSDWRLPTSDELNEMYLNLYVTGLANFPENYYWSSTLDINGFAYAQYFNGSSKNVTGIFTRLTRFTCGR